ncbi:MULTISPECIES: 5-guanidino-2-oxopentanoate decarboxylase [unclassified Modicisalibacter]|uniref:5-guanidino-2-oxopentanoate decarboxylase n=1 Tax=unclassified Modicisalibacter TaxID=2679913 RepID=UPI001CCA89DD|nr:MULTISPECIES: 5-guanidino-2-oxopentanoate decarboxylase [unclassified Modicisalibacter]MBZ9559570.1 5-guanidino-2-oxopentanoate decarboxylase [Modicisalibacter sp. R2A 31.J]MBZ9577022.1 5-guanidino-2-oxopentanoate decarboxylase [Modicisalibacter sp. MOD 31.J]
MTCAELLIHLLVERHGVDTVFGIPGVHTVELYRGLDGQPLRHVTPRHEQGAGFMADGYARASGKPGVCLIITGPGMTNIATAMGQALADSVPMLVISSVNRRDTLGRGQGRLHELPSQQQTLAGVARFSHTLLDPAALPEVLDRAFATFASARPGPVHIEIPIDLFAMPAATPRDWTGPRLYPPAVDPQGLALAASWLREAERPLVLLGGGCVDAPEAARTLVERLDAPTVTTINAKGLLGRDHPLDLGANAALPAVRELAREADVILAVGTELGETDYDVVFDDGFTLDGRLIRIDIDAQQLVRNQATSLGLVGDAAGALRQLLAFVPEPMSRDGVARTTRTLEALALADDPALAPFVPLFDTLRQALPEAVLVGDSTAPVYAANHLVSQPEPRRYFNASTGFGTLGYGLPAALGASLARPDLPVVALVGDGGAMFTLSELATAVEERLPVVVLLWHNAGYEEIRRYMDAHEVPRCGVDLRAPDFQTLAAGFGCQASRVDSPRALAAAIATRADDGPCLIEIDAHRWPNG